MSFYFQLSINAQDQVKGKMQRNIFAIDKNYKLLIFFSLGQEVIYYQNAEFPQGSTMPTMCIFSIAVKDDTICQIRYIA